MLWNFAVWVAEDLGKGIGRKLILRGGQAVGMIGYYVAIPEEQIKLLAQGELMLEDLDPYALEQLDIDKSWQGIHYLLCKELDNGEPPLGYAVPMLDDQGLDFGEFGAFYLTHEQVVEASAALAQLSESALKDRYDFAEFAKEQVYPIIEGEDGGEFLDYLLGNLVNLQVFYRKAEAEGEGIVFYIS